MFDACGDTINPTLVLLHGAAALDTFAHQYEMLSQRFHVLVPHLPGAGEAAAELYDPQQVCDALAGWIASLNVGKVLLMGHSIGGQLALKLVCEHEHLFSRAVFLSPWVCSTEASARRFANLARMSYGAIRRASLLRMQAQYWGFTTGADRKARCLQPANHAGNLSRLLREARAFERVDALSRREDPHACDVRAWRNERDEGVRPRAG